MPRLKEIFAGCRQLAGHFGSPELFALLTLISGAVLLFSGATPALASRIELIKNVVPLPVLEIAHFLASLIGTAVDLSGPGLPAAVGTAYRLTLIFLAGGILLSLVKGIDYEEALALAVLLGALLLVGRGSFLPPPVAGEPEFFSVLDRGDRHHSYSARSGWASFLLNMSIILTTCGGNSPSPGTPRVPAATTGAIILAFVLVLNRLLRPGTPRLPLRPPRTSKRPCR